MSSSGPGKPLIICSQLAAVLAPPHPRYHLPCSRFMVIFAQIQIFRIMSIKPHSNKLLLPTSEMCPALVSVLKNSQQIVVCSEKKSLTVTANCVWQTQSTAKSYD